MSPSALNQTLAALKRLAAEAAANGWLDPAEAGRIRRLPMRRQLGVRCGRWLTADEVRRLLAAPDRTTAHGRRDYAVLALLVGCGLRRSELVGITRSQVQERDGRTMLVDVVGKGGRIRTVTVPEWVRAGIDAVTADEGLGTHQNAFCNGTVALCQSRKPHYDAQHPTTALPPASNAGQTSNGNGNGRSSAPLCAERVTGSESTDRQTNTTGTTSSSTDSRLLPLSTPGVWWIVRRYARVAGLPPIAPHDLRRTLARLARKAGCPLETVQATLGHASIATTLKYIGYVDANAGDFILL